MLLMQQRPLQQNKFGVVKAKNKSKWECEKGYQILRICVIFTIKQTHLQYKYTILIDKQSTINFAAVKVVYNVKFRFWQTPYTLPSPTLLIMSQPSSSIFWISGSLNAPRMWGNNQFCLLYQFGLISRCDFIVQISSEHKNPVSFTSKCFLIQF